MIIHDNEKAYYHTMFYTGTERKDYLLQTITNQ